VDFRTQESQGHQIEHITTIVSSQYWFSEEWPFWLQEARIEATDWPEGPGSTTRLDVPIYPSISVATRGSLRGLADS
jgi:hypothetical protein